MTIAVMDGGHTFFRHTRAYADYRIASSLARFSDIVRKAAVSLTSSPVDGESVICCVAVTIRGGTRIRVTARGCRANEAIDRAAERTGDALRRHVDTAESLCPCTTWHTH